MIHSFRFNVLEPLKGKKKIMGKKQHLKNTIVKNFPKLRKKLKSPIQTVLQN